MTPEEASLRQAASGLREILGPSDQQEFDRRIDSMSREEINQQAKEKEAREKAAKTCGYVLVPDYVIQQILERTKHRPELQDAHAQSSLNSSLVVESKLMFFSVLAGKRGKPTEGEVKRYRDLVAHYGGTTEDIPANGWTILEDSRKTPFQAILDSLRWIIGLQ